MLSGRYHFLTCSYMYFISLHPLVCCLLQIFLCYFYQNICSELWFMMIILKLSLWLQSVVWNNTQIMTLYRPYQFPCSSGTFFSCAVSCIWRPMLSSCHGMCGTYSWRRCSLSPLLIRLTLKALVCAGEKCSLFKSMAALSWYNELTNMSNIISTSYW